ncbi:MAG: hypothetical protein JO117_11380, partial [Verrucomicrobia bacterium]|nr:hypothetical protein [Verrucomicrobiota bacterium]
GFATATKYLGVLALLYATALELMAPRAATMRHPSWRLLALWLVAVGTTLLLSISSWWGRFPELAQALLEAGHTTQAGNEAVGARVPHGQFVGMFFIETPPLVLLGVALFCRRAWPRDARSIRTHFDRWLLLSAPFVLLLVFSFSAITAVRYFLPISVLLSCLGGCGLALGMQSASAWAHERWGFRPSVTTCAAVAVCGLFQLPALLSLERGFATDDRRALREFVSTQLPPDAVIATESLAGLDAAPALRQRVLTRKAIAELGDLAALRAQGVTHVVVCWYDSRRYVDPSKHPARGTEAEFLRRRDFYLGLEKHARLLWHRDIAQPFPLRPGLSLYALDEK